MSRNKSEQIAIDALLDNIKVLQAHKDRLELELRQLRAEHLKVLSNLSKEK